MTLLALPAMLIVSTQISRAQTQEAKSSGYPSAGARAVATLLSPGAAPRTRLRYGVPKNYKEHVVLNSDGVSSATMNGSAMPAMPTPATARGVDLSVIDVSSTGDVTYAIAFTGVSSPDTGNPLMTSAVQNLDADYRMITGTVTVSDRGINRVVKFDFSKLTNPQRGPILASTWENISTTLPEEPIGVGARWEVKQTVNTDGIQAQERIEYELTAFDGKVLTLNAKIEQTATPQAMANPAMPAGSETLVKKYTAAGIGTLKVRLDSPVPAGERTMKSTMEMEVTAMGNTMTVTAETSVKLTMAVGK